MDSEDEGTGYQARPTERLLAYRERKDIGLADTPRVTIWNEYRHEKTDDEVKEIYPDGIHAVLASALGDRGWNHELPRLTNRSMVSPMTF